MGATGVVQKWRLIIIWKVHSKSFTFPQITPGVQGPPQPWAYESEASDDKCFVFWVLDCMTGHLMGLVHWNRAIRWFVIAIDTLDPELHDFINMTRHGCHVAIQGRDGSLLTICDFRLRLESKTSNHFSKFLWRFWRFASSDCKSLAIEIVRFWCDKW